MNGTSIAALIASPIKRLVKSTLYSFKVNNIVVHNDNPTVTKAMKTENLNTCGPYLLAP